MKREKSYDATLLEFVAKGSGHKEPKEALYWAMSCLGIGKKTGTDKVCSAKCSDGFFSLSGKGNEVEFERGNIRFYVLLHNTD